MKKLTHVKASNELKNKFEELSNSKKLWTKIACITANSCIKWLSSSAFRACDLLMSPKWWESYHIMTLYSDWLYDISCLLPKHVLTTIQSIAPSLDIDYNTISTDNYENEIAKLVTDHLLLNHWEITTEAIMKTLCDDTEVNVTYSLSQERWARLRPVQASSSKPLDTFRTWTINMQEWLLLQKILSHFNNNTRDNNTFTHWAFAASWSHWVQFALQTALEYQQMSWNTNKNKIVRADWSYHGTSPTLDNTSQFELIPNDLISVSRALTAPNVWVVILEWTPGNHWLLTRNIPFLEAVQQQCKEYWIILIMDEVITWYRLPWWSATAWYKNQWCDLQPDIIAFGKAITSGAWWFVCTKEMSKALDTWNVYFAGTNNGSSQTLQEVTKNMKYYEEHKEKISQLSRKLADKCSEFNNRAIEHNIKIHSHSIWTLFTLYGDTNTLPQSPDQIPKKHLAIFTQIRKSMHSNWYTLHGSWEDTWFFNYEAIELLSNDFFQTLRNVCTELFID